MKKEDNYMDPQELLIEPISARQFLDLIPFYMSEEEKGKKAAEMEQRYKDIQTVTEDEKRFREILESVGRKGTEEFLHYLKSNGFFIAPGSVTYHSNWKGGLANHSLKVYDYAMMFREEMLKKDPSLESELDPDSIAVTALLHDVCKMDEYDIKSDGTPVHKNPRAPFGVHGDKSVVFIIYHGYHLEGDEIVAIRWHMGSKHIKDSMEKRICEDAKKDFALLRLIIRADHEAATQK